MISAPSAVASRPARVDQGTWTLAAADGGLALLVVALPHVIASDGATRFHALEQLLSGRGLSPLAYSLIGPIFSTPLFLLGRAVVTPEWWCARYNAALLVLGVFAIGSMVSRLAGRRLAGLFVLLLVAASMFPNHVRGYTGETFTAICVAAGLLAFARDRFIVGAALVAAGVANTPATVVGLAFASAAMVWDTRRIRFVIPLMAAAALIVLENWLRRGGPFVSGYEGNHGVQTVLPYSGLPGFSYPLFFGLMSTLFSFGKGLVFFAPGLLLPLPPEVPERLRAFWRYSIWFVAGCVLVYSRWWAWYGGWTWGPRFFLFASVPASLAIAATLERYRTLGSRRLALLAVLLVLSTWVAIDGGTFDQGNLGVCLDANYALELLCWYVPEFSALWRPFVTAPTTSATELLFAAYCAGVGIWLAGPVVAEMGRRLKTCVVTEARPRLRTLRY